MHLYDSFQDAEYDNDASDSDLSDSDSSTTDLSLLGDVLIDLSDFGSVLQNLSERSLAGIDVGPRILNKYFCGSPTSKNEPLELSDSNMTLLGLLSVDPITEFLAQSGLHGILYDTAAFEDVDRRS